MPDPKIRFRSWRNVSERTSAYITLVKISVLLCMVFQTVFPAYILYRVTSNDVPTKEKEDNSKVDLDDLKFGTSDAPTKEKEDNSKVDLDVLEFGTYGAPTKEKEDNSKVDLDGLEFGTYDAWLQSKSQIYHQTCPGWKEYKTYIEAMFANAPDAPHCNVVSSFAQTHNQTRDSRGLFLLQRSTIQGLNHQPPIPLHDPFKPLTGRHRDLAEMWEHTNLERNLPPQIEMLVSFQDKPRVLTDLGLPPFVISGEFPVGSRLKPKWTGYMPFPSHFFWTVGPQNGHDKDFLSRKPMVSYRGYFSEHCWARFDTDPGHCNHTARFKLAMGTRKTQDADVLDVKLTGFARKDANHEQIQEALFNNFNITMAKPQKFSLSNSRYALAVSGNGWAGATMMKSLQSGCCIMFIEDKSIDEEGYTRQMGEIYFPFLKPGEDVVIVDYDTIAPVARELNANPGKAVGIAHNGVQFSQKFLGKSCALDLIELLAWNYYNYVKGGCPSAFSHIVRS